MDEVTQQAVKDNRREYVVCMEWRAGDNQYEPDELLELLRVALGNDYDIKWYSCEVYKRARVAALEKALQRAANWMKDLADSGDAGSFEAKDIKEWVEAEALLHPEAQSLTLDKVADPKEKGTTK